jgi:hypothetical protein
MRSHTRHTNRSRERRRVSVSLAPQLRTTHSRPPESAALPGIVPTIPEQHADVHGDGHDERRQPVQRVHERYQQGFRPCTGVTIGDGTLDTCTAHAFTLAISTVIV